MHNGNDIDNAPFCYLSFNDSGEILGLNETLCRQLGYLKTELTGKKLETIFPIASRIFYQTHLFPLLKMQGHAEEIFIFLLGKNREQLPVLLNASRAENAEGTYNQCAGIVVKNRKKFEDELVKAKKTAETALHENTELKKAREALASQAEILDNHIRLIKRQNNELKQMGRVATHNLTEPLRKAQVFANLLKNSPAADSRQKELQHKLLKAVNLMNETVLGLQQFTWLSEETIQPLPIDMNALVIKTREQLAEELKEDLLELKVAKLPALKADDRQFRLLFYHLLLNAVQYRKPGKKAIVIIAANLIKKNSFSSTDRYQYRDFLKITVQDEGMGFEPQYGNQVFEMFKKLHHSNQRGLGLSFCKMIVENHGGAIEAHSKPGEGTTISMFFPGEMLVENF